jgi:N6-L-threonylcarbamoyladenine synthase
LLNEEVKFPALCLIVSGGHTELIYMRNHGKYERIGGTRDDAVGEAFDKVAKMMDLGYPGGPIISRLAAKKCPTSNAQYSLPRPMINTGDFEMSFSGLKTAVLHALSKIKKITPTVKVAICHEFQEAVSDVLIYKTIDAAQKLKAKSIVLGGGVSANQVLRQKLSSVAKNQLPQVNIYLPELKYTGDNAVMVGLAAFHHLKKKEFISPFGFRADPNWELV